MEERDPQTKKKLTIHEVYVNMLTVNLNFEISFSGQIWHFILYQFGVNSVYFILQYINNYVIWVFFLLEQTLVV
jgi:hypothetical protein